MSELLRRGAAIVGWIVLLTVLYYGLSLYQLGVAVTIGVNALLALGLVLITGFGGQFSLAQAAWFGIGAYGSGLLTVKQGWPALLALLASAAVAIAVAFLLARPIFRLRSHFLAMGTLALCEIFFVLINNLELTGASSGFGGITPFSLLGYEFANVETQFWLVGIVLGAGIWALVHVKAGRDGRALRALRSHEIAAASCGVNVSWAKTRAFAGSACFGAIAGSLFAHTLLYVNPPAFGVLKSIDVLSVAVIGGLMSPWGPLIGAVAFQLIRQWIEDILPSILGEDSVGAGASLVFGAILVLVLILRPDGLVGGLSQLWHAVRQRIPALARSRAAPAAKPGKRVHSQVIARTYEGPALEARGLTKIFGGLHALEDVDLTVGQREILAVIGPNGAGKSTLTNLLSGALFPTRGQVFLAGREITKTPAHARAALGMARTFQTPSLFAGMRTRETVLVGAHVRGKVGLTRSALPTLGAVREERRLAERVDEILDGLGLTDIADSGATELSLGQQKMVEVARALAQDPAVLLLDEPCAGLNRVEKLALADTLRGLRDDGVSLLVIEHDMEFVMGLADRVHVIEFGRTLRVGTPAEVQSDEAVIAAYLGVPHDEPEAVPHG